MGEPDPDAVDYYSRIGVGPDADIETIERQRKQADRRFSPMSSSPEADEKRHMQINAASNVLEDPERRERYDTFYETFGRVEGTAVYETLSDVTAGAVVDDGRLLDHLRGFVEVLGPVGGAREFQRYYQQLNPPLSAAFEDLDLPDGYDVSDPGFGVAAWSFRGVDEPCPFDLWLTGGQDLWRTALEEPEEVPEMIEELEAGREQVTDRPTTRLDETDGDEEPSTEDLPSRYVPGRGEAAARWPSFEISTPTRRVGRAFAYLGRTAVWATTSTAVAGASGALGLVVALVVFVPLLALGLVVESSLPGVADAVRSAAGVPLADAGDPFGRVSFVHYVTVGLLVASGTGLAGRAFVWTHGRREGGLPRDAWLVFGTALAALVASLFVGVGADRLPRPLAVASTALVTAVTFQAAMDVGAPRLLADLCQSVSTLAYGLVGAVGALVATDAALSAVAPELANTTFRELLRGLPLAEPPLLTLDNAELAVVVFGALALVPLALTTLYSLAYAVESVAIRWREPQGS